MTNSVKNVMLGIRNIPDKINRYSYRYTGLRLLVGHVRVSDYFAMKRDLRLLRKQAKDSPIGFPVTKLDPCYEDKHDHAGNLMYHYFWQDLHVARRIFLNNPLRHIDIGSRVDGFVAHVAAFRSIDVFDIRPLDQHIPHVTFTQMDLMDLQPEYEQCTDSISCLHALEHFGLGRYGDPVRYDGYLIGFSNIAKMLKPDGRFYFSVPLGPQRIEFHAQRVFSMKYLLEMVSVDFDISSFSFVDDKNKFHENVVITPRGIAYNFYCEYGCAIFELIKK